jgi:hypothetical protein
MLTADVTKILFAYLAYYPAKPVFVEMRTISVFLKLEMRCIITAKAI